MKVAFCFFGHFRKFEQTHNQWNFLIDSYDSDVFIHTWNHRGLYTGGVSEEMWNGLADDTQTIDHSALSEYHRLFQPTSFLVEHYPTFEPTLQTISESIYNVRRDIGARIIDRPLAFLSMCYSRYKVMLLVAESMINYDMVILSRPDVTLESLPHIVPNPNELILESKYSYSGASDMLMIGTEDVITTVSTLFYDVIDTFNSNVDDISTSKDSAALLSIIDPHLSLKRFCEHNAINIRTDPNLIATLIR